MREEKEKLKRKHTPRPSKNEPKAQPNEQLKAEESKQPLSTDDRWAELVKELRGSTDERWESRLRADERRLGLWSRKGDDVADGLVEAVTDSDTDSQSSVGGRPIILGDLASSSSQSSDAPGIETRSAKRHDFHAASFVQHMPAVQHMRRRHVAYAAPRASHAVFADGSPSRHHAYDDRSQSAEPSLLWSQPSPPRTPPASFQRPSDSLWSTPPPQLQLHSRPRAAYYTPQPHYSAHLEAPAHARLLELPETLLHPPATHGTALPRFVPLRSSGTAIDLSSDEEEEEAEEAEEAEAQLDEQVVRPRRTARSVGRAVRQQWVNLFDEERLAVFSDLQDDTAHPPVMDIPRRPPPAHVAPRVQHTAQPVHSAQAAASETLGGAEDGELQDDELLQKARELNYHALLLKKKRAGQAPVLSSASTPDTHSRQLAVSPAVEQKVEAEMAKLRQRLQPPPPNSIQQPAIPVPQPVHTPQRVHSRPLTPNQPTPDARRRARSVEQQRLSDKLAAIEQKLAESPPPPVRRNDSVAREDDDERRRRQHMEQLQQQRQEEEARGLTHQLHTILLSPPSTVTTPRTLTPPPLPNIPLVSVHPALKPVPLPPQARERLTLLKAKHHQHSRTKAGGGDRGGGRSGMGQEEEELYDEAQALIAAFRTEFGGAMKAHAENL